MPLHGLPQGFGCRRAGRQSVSKEGKRMTASIQVRRTFTQKLWYAWYKAMGWSADYHEPGFSKFIVIVWPHTSNLDFFIGFIFSRAYVMPFPHFLAKESFFVGPLGWLGRKVGGIPVDRS